MTGQKDRYTTTEKLWKLDDETLTTPKHDEMVIWLLNKDNIKSIIKKDEFVHNIIKPILYSTENMLDYVAEYHGYKPYDSIPVTYDPVPVINIDEEWGFTLFENHKTDPFSDEPIPFKSTRNRVDGLRFIYNIVFNTNMDKHPRHIQNIRNGLSAELNEIKTHLNEQRSVYDFLSIESEKPLVSGYNKFIVGYADIYLSFKIPEYKTEHFMLKYDMLNIINSCCIEVKSSIKSFGQTLRQLKTYQEHLPKNTIMCLFSTDTKFKKAFESQGIKVLTYPIEQKSI